MEVVPGVYQLRALGARVTALMGHDGIVLVDAGGRGSLPMIAAGLAKLGAALDQVRLVVLTHSHPDHAGGLARLVEATSARVAIHRTEEAIISGAEPVPTPFRNALLARLTRPILPLLYGKPVRVDHPLDNGATLDWAEEVQVVHTPGHTRGSISLYVASKRVLIVGDALQHRFRRLSPPARSVTQDYDQARDSLKQLTSFDFQLMVFSHFPPLRQNARETLERLVGRQDTGDSQDRR